jgi:hypothetical protein
MNINNKIKLIVFDNYYKCIDTFHNFLFTEKANANIIRDLPNKEPTLIDFEKLEGYDNDNIIQEKEKFETLLNSQIKNIQSKVVVIDSSFKLDDDSWYGIVFISREIYTRNGIIFKNKSLQSADEQLKRDYITAKNNRIVIFHNKYCQSINIIDKLMLEIIKIQV